MAHDHDKAEPEELAVEAYMDQLGGSSEAPTEEERKAYLKRQYEGVKATAKSLQLERAVIERMDGKKREDAMNNMRGAFAENYKFRKIIVTEMRKLGEKVEDQFIPLSAV